MERLRMGNKKKQTRSILTNQSNVLHLQQTSKDRNNMCVPGSAGSRYINFYTDFAFKKIFGTEANKDLLISFLNALLDLKESGEIIDLTYLNTEKLGDSISDRRAIYDVYCQTMSGERFIVEMQNAKQDHFKDRSLYYSSFAIQEQAKKGAKDSRWDYSLSPVYVIGILDFVIDEKENVSDKVITRVKLKDDCNKTFSDKLNFIFLEMPKFRKTVDELETFVDKWLYVIKNLYHLEDKPSVLSEGVFDKLFEVAEIAAFSKNERYDYEENLKNFLDMYNIMRTVKNEGIAEGEVLGMQKMAKNLKNQGVDANAIAIASGLSIEEIDKL